MATVKIKTGDGQIKNLRVGDLGNNSIINIVRMTYGKNAEVIEVTETNGLPIKFPKPVIDAGGRLRVSQLTTLGDYKQINDKLPLFFDEEVIGGATAPYTKSRGGTVMNVSTDGDAVIRQTKQWHNYSSGKSQFVELTFDQMQSQANVTKRVGYFSSDETTPFDSNKDGIWLESNGSGVYLKVSKDGTEKISVEQSEWNLDTLDGNGESGLTLDFSNFNVFVFDFLYLGGTTVRFGFFVNGGIVWVHEYHHSTYEPDTILLSPNQPVRYEIRSTGGSGSMTHICTQVSTEGSLDPVGIFKSINTGGDLIDCQFQGTKYPLLGLRLRGDYRNISICICAMSFVAGTPDEALVEIMLNPTISGTFVWNNVNGAAQVSIGDGSQTVTDGQVFYSFVVNQRGNITSQITEALKIGSSIAGVRDEIYVVVTPLSNGLDAGATITYKQFI